MSHEIRIQDLTASEIAELLAEDGRPLTRQQAVALRQFVEDIGGVENAFAAVEMLDELERAA